MSLTQTVTANISEARTNLVNNENGDLFVDSHSMLNTWENYCRP